MRGKAEVLVVHVSAPAEEAPALARRLVECQLAACVSLIPGVRSIYRWQGALEDSEETVLVIKSTTDAFPALEAEVKKHHSYQVPEIIGLSVLTASEAYASWVRDGVRSPS